jgi:hypothetical protein
LDSEIATIEGKFAADDKIITDTVLADVKAIFAK